MDQYVVSYSMYPVRRVHGTLGLGGREVGGPDANVSLGDSPGPWTYGVPNGLGRGKAPSLVTPFKPKPVLLGSVDGRRRGAVGPREEMDALLPISLAMGRTNCPPLFRTINQ